MDESGILALTLFEGPAGATRHEASFFGVATISVV
jgi:hypothetical protein